MPNDLNEAMKILRSRCGIGEQCPRRSPRTLPDLVPLGGTEWGRALDV